MSLVLCGTSIVIVLVCFIYDAQDGTQGLYVLVKPLFFVKEDHRLGSVGPQSECSHSESPGSSLADPDSGLTPAC